MTRPCPQTGSKGQRFPGPRLPLKLAEEARCHDGVVDDIAGDLSLPAGLPINSKENRTNFSSSGDVQIARMFSRSAEGESS